MRQGFLSGSDDYMVKPVNVNEMVLRVGAVSYTHLSLRIFFNDYFSFRWQQKQKGIWAFWLAHNNARCYAWNRKYYIGRTSASSPVTTVIAS